jgi:DNA-binding NarL/FixJ family response regulator
MWSRVSVGDITVVVVDDHMVVRRGIRALLETEPGIEVIGEADNGEAVLRLIRALACDRGLPDVVLMDLMMPKSDGVVTTAEIRRTWPGVQVVAMTSFSEAERISSMLESGAAGYILKDADAAEVTAAIRAAYRGDVHLAPAVARKLTQRMFHGGRQATSLTQREREVLTFVARGASNQEIADALKITERTARSHVSGVLSKLGLTSRTQAAVWAIREGIVSQP